MHTIYVYVYNRHGEVEQEQSFNAKTKAAASAKASRWCAKGWGKNWRSLFTVKTRTNTLTHLISSWELR